MLRAAIFLLFLVQYGCSIAQNGWSVQALPGFLAAHHEQMQAMGTHTLGIALSREWKIDGGDGSLAKSQKQPYAGITVNHIAMFKDINGNLTSMLGYYDVGLLGNENAGLRIRITTGLGLLSKQWNVFTNPRNRAIGSSINGSMQLACYTQTRLTERTRLQLGLSLIHYSNGNFGQPNLGINLPCLFVGLKTLDGTSKHYTPRFPINPNRVEWQPSLRFGKKQMSMDDPRNIFNYMGEIKLLYPHKPHRFWTAAVSGFYDRTYVYTKFQPLPKTSMARVTEIAVSGGHEYRVGRVAMLADLGFYLYRPDNSKRRYYQAWGVKYYASQAITAMVRMRTHLSMADYLEWGVAYRIHSNKSVKPGFGEGWKWAFRGFRPSN